MTALAAEPAPALAGGGFGRPAARPRGPRAGAAEWFDTPAGGVALLILTTLGARLVFAGSLGLGMDESYMVAAGRHLHLSYFDHPPLAWWMAWAGAHLAGTDAPWAVRLPFVLNFALATWLMYRLAAGLFDECAGLWAAALLNAAPVLGVTTGAWVLPDGPMVTALLGAAVCLASAMRRPAGRGAWGWWLGAGACAGLAMLSKYSAVLSAGGAAVFLLTAPSGRRWLSRPQPYAAGLLALALFSPVIVWNAEHGWASLLFQGGRAASGRLHPFGPLAALGGEALFLLPWVWAPLVFCGWLALRRGWRDERSWLLVCLAVPAVAVFTAAALWTHVLFHWATPGYLMLFPLLGEFVARRRRDSRALRVYLAATAAFVSVGALFVASEVRFNWLPEVAEDFALGTDPDLAAVDWTSLRTELGRRGLLARPGLAVAATRWFDAGKIDYALDGLMPVVCLGPDPREYGVTTDLRGYAGQDMLIAAPRGTLATVAAQFGASFDGIEALPPVMLRHAGRPAMLLPVFLAHRLRADGVAGLRA